jgi:hypothetical protein
MASRGTLSIRVALRNQSDSHYFQSSSSESLSYYLTLKPEILISAPWLPTPSASFTDRC